MKMEGTLRSARHANTADLCAVVAPALDGTSEDRAVSTMSHRDVVDHETLLTAYEEQICTEETAS
jgi:hypothetical protein